MSDKTKKTENTEPTYTHEDMIFFGEMVAKEQITETDVEAYFNSIREAKAKGLISGDGSVIKIVGLKNTLEFISYRNAKLKNTLEELNEADKVFSKANILRAKAKSAYDNACFMDYSNYVHEKMLDEHHLKDGKEADNG